ncbi:MAG TPA: glycerate kinase [Candidatus Polarisedimenticolia bacterium]|nr:glycerate kinase [Candidatus Polarisedimenticolia bacterium]
MKFLLAPDKFRGTFTASEVCALLSEGIRQEDPGAVLDAAPMADGGEGTLEAVLRAQGGTMVPVRARGPLGEWIDAAYGVTAAGAAVIESARVCGLRCLPAGEPRPLEATTYGLGQVVATALEAGARTILLGLGGTATTDGGAGMAEALGYRISREEAEGEVVHTIDASMAHPGLATARVTALCDVSHPLLGPAGSAAVFGPQKGAGPAEVAVLESRLAALARGAARLTGRPEAELAGDPGAGAGGGLGMGAAVFLGARLVPGAIFLAGLMLLSRRAEEADVVVTGEGSLDSQTLGGKVVSAVLELAAEAGRPALVAAGRWDGTLPERRPEPTEVLAGADQGGGIVARDGLIRLGRHIARRARGLAKPEGRC